MDRTKVDRVLEPLIDLRLACNHPQLILRKRTFINTGHHTANKERLLTIEASLKILMKKTQSECDNIFRAGIMNSNALAGLNILANRKEQAIDIYEHVLKSAEVDYGGNVKLDLIQKVHTLYNYIELLKEQEDREEEIKTLEKTLTDCETIYVGNFSEEKIKNCKKFEARQDQIKENLNQVNNYLNFV
jgi:hypothetical protein